MSLYYDKHGYNLNDDQFCFRLILMSGPLRSTSGTVSTVTTLVSSPRAFSVDSEICRSVSYAARTLRSYALQMLAGENTR